MTNPESDRSMRVDSAKMSLTSDHRMVYRPAGKVQWSFTRWLPLISIPVAVIAVLLIVFLANHQPTPLVADQTLPVASVKTQNLSPVSTVTFAAISDPSQEWTTAFRALAQAASGSEEALLLSSMSQLVRMKPGPTKLTAEQRTSVRSHSIKGLAAIKASRFGEAGDEFLAAYQIDSTDAEVAENLGYALLKDGKIGPATRALLRSLMAAPQRSTAWGNLGGAYAHGGEKVLAIAAFTLSLRYAKSPTRTRNNLVSLYQEDPSEAVRSAVSVALASYYTRMVDPSLRDQLGDLSQFPFSALLPQRMQQTNDTGTTASVFALNNSDFPITASATEYSVWLGSKKDCGAKVCIVGRIAGSKSTAQTDDEGTMVELAGGMQGVLHKVTEQKMAHLTIARDGISHSFSFDNEAGIVLIANSALGLGPIPVSIFTGRPTGRQVQVKTTAPDSGPWVSTPESMSSLVGMLTTSPKGPLLTSEEIYKRVSGSVVVVTVSDGQGSGVVVAPEIVLTNCHVAKQGNVAVNYRRERYAAVVVAGNDKLDYCILKAAGLPAAPAPMGALTEVAPGQRVYSLGSPQGFELTIAEGMVSAVRPWEGMPLRIIQTTASISPGSSGGGLFDEFGRLIGITSFFRKESQNLNFAMPVEFYRYVTPATAPKPRQAALAVIPVPAVPPEGGQSAIPRGQPRSNYGCDIQFTIDLQTFGENVSVELRSGSPGSSLVVGIQKSQGGTVSFFNLCSGSYFIAIGNDDNVSVTPIREFVSGQSYTSRLTLQRGSGNVSKQNRKNL
ncbi:MAG: trypsin-like peptidase domain-containing protein [Polaromonas sp.]|nr:trypsin-like peptidase domain-containing protein [Polaromonas sp.]